AHPDHAAFPPAHARRGAGPGHQPPGRHLRGRRVLGAAGRLGPAHRQAAFADPAFQPAPRNRFRLGCPPPATRLYPAQRPPPCACPRRDGRPAQV
ncbi:MAG: hypothetical protein AVDCRST_MAG51-2834, partial [uncultured Ramlibacter sp.]